MERKNAEGECEELVSSSNGILSAFLAIKVKMNIIIICISIPHYANSV